MKLLIATDHRGVDYKKRLIEILGKEYDMVDVSPDNYPTDDYPDFAFRLSHMLLKETEPSFGILICGTGIGMCIAANKVDGIRCALVHSAEASRLARYHDDANVIAIDSNMDPEFSAECIRIFTKTSLCEEEKYGRRVQKVIDYENGTYNEL
jgi:ribose 5-phosphate isomerase B